MKSYNTWTKQSSKTKDLLESVRETVHSVLPDSEVILYGSRARGEAEVYSDWDFLVLAAGEVDRQTVRILRDKLYDLELETGEVLSCIVRNRSEWSSSHYAVLPFKKNVEREGVVL